MIARMHRSSLSTTLAFSLGIPAVALLLGISQCSDPADVDNDGDDWTENEGDCNDADSSINPSSAESCNEIDDDCDATVDEGACVSAPWESNGAYAILTKNDGSIFQGQDCDSNFFGTDVADVGGVPFAVGPYLTSSGHMAGLLPGGVAVATPGSSYTIHNAYLIFPGGRCTDQPLEVAFAYTDGTVASAGTATIPWDCSSLESVTGDYFQVSYQGNYGGACCSNWYSGRFANPDPSRLVSQILVTYYDGCNGAYTGQMWALTVD